MTGIRRTILTAAGAVAFVYFTLLALPISYFPSAGLDASWSLGITEAALHHLVFGRDIVFTYGPLGYIVGGAMTPQMYRPIVFGRIVLGAAVAALVVWTGAAAMPWYRRASFYAAIAIAIAGSESRASMTVTAMLLLAIALVAGRSPQVDARALAFGIVAGVLALTKFTNAFDFALAIGAALVLRAAWRATVVFTVALVSTSAVAFASVSYGAPIATALFAIAVCALIVAEAARSGRYRLAPGRYDVPALGLALVMAALLGGTAPYRAFVATSLQVSLGYSSAMATGGPSYQVVLAVLLLALIAVVAFANRASLGWGGAGGLLLVAWLAFKEGFVRQDEGHIFEFYCTAVIIGAILVGRAAGRRGFAVATLAFGVSLVVLAQVHAAISGGALKTPLAVQTLVDNARIVRSVRGAPPEQTDLAAALAPDVLAPTDRARIATMPVDVQPWETGIIFANGLQWQPEPVFQAYSAYTPALDRIDADDLVTKPRRILFQDQSIDGRYLFAESPEARKTLICRYGLDPNFGAQTVATAGKDAYLVLVPHANRCLRDVPIGSVQLRWNVPARVPPPVAGTLLFASFQIKLGVLGTVEKFLYRAPAVYVTFGRGDGASPPMRILPDQSAEGILIDPVPLDTTGVAALLQHRLEPSTRTLTLSSDDPALYGSEISTEYTRVQLAGES